MSQESGMFMNGIIAKEKADAAYWRALDMGLSDYAANLIHERTFRTELAHLDKWVTENVGLN